MINKLVMKWLAGCVFIAAIVAVFGFLMLAATLNAAAQFINWIS